MQLSSHDRVDLWVIVPLTALSTWWAWLAWPAWDDAWLALVATEGPATIRQNMVDRPLVGLIWAGMARLGFLKEGSAVLHFATWGALALLTRRLWTALFPKLSHLALLPSLVALSTLVVQQKYILAAVTPTSVLPAVLVWAGLLWAWRWPEAQIGLPRRLAGFACMLSGCALSEYGTAAALAALGLCFVVGGPFFTGGRGRWRSDLAWTTGAAALGYLIFSRLEDSAFREITSPDYALARFDVLELPFRIVALLLQIFALVLVEPLVALDPEAKKAIVASLGVGGLLAVAIGLRRSGSRRRPAGWALVLGALAAGIVAGYLPVLLFDRPITIGTRFWIPVVPLVACATVAAPVGVLRSRAHAALAGLIGISATYAFFTEMEHRVESWRQTRAWSEPVREELHPHDLTIAVFDPQLWDADTEPVDYELTARLALPWREWDRLRFWAYVDGTHHRPGRLPADWRDRSTAFTMERDARGYEVSGRVARVLWCRLVDGRRTIEVLDLEAVER